MHEHREQQFLPYTQEQLFDLVADIERYPEFLPWCRAARILERKEGECTAELVISFKHMTESYVSRVTLERLHRIEANLVRGPFAKLVNRWEFAPENNGTRVDFFVDFAFRSRMLGALIGAFFEKATQKMGAAFKDRADFLYGHKT